MSLIISTSNGSVFWVYYDYQALYLISSVQPQTQTWIKEADEKTDAKMQDICSKETKTTAASLYSARNGLFVLLCHKTYITPRGHMVPK